MTSKERVRRTFNFEKTDRVTIGYEANGNIHANLCRALNINPGDYEGLLRALGVDYRAISAPYIGKPLYKAPEGRAVDPLEGCIMRWVEHGTGGYWDFCDFPLKDADDEMFDNFPVPNPDDFDYDAALEIAKSYNGEYGLYVGNAGVPDVINSNGRIMGVEDVLVHLLLDEREINQDFITNYDYTEYMENADGTKEVTTVFFAVCDKATNTITLKNVNWTILDMDGKETALEIGNIPGMLPDNFSSLISLVINGSDLGPIINPILSDLAGILASEGILGANINVIVETGPFVTEDAIKISLRPTTGYYYPEVLENTEIHRGTLGYQEMAWLESNGLIYALVTLFSTRRVFLLFAAWIAVINILIGMVRGMCKEEKEKKRKIDAVQAPQKRIAPTYGTIRPYM